MQSAMAKAASICYIQWNGLGPLLTGAEGGKGEPTIVAREAGETLRGSQRRGDFLSWHVRSEHKLYVPPQSLSSLSPKVLYFVKPMSHI